MGQSDEGRVCATHDPASPFPSSCRHPLLISFPGQCSIPGHETPGSQSCTCATYATLVLKTANGGRDHGYNLSLSLTIEPNFEIADLTPRTLSCRGRGLRGKRMILAKTAAKMNSRCHPPCHVMSCYALNKQSKSKCHVLVCFI